MINLTAISLSSGAARSCHRHKDVVVLGLYMYEVYVLVSGIPYFFILKIYLHSENEAASLRDSKPTAYIQKI